MMPYHVQPLSDLGGYRPTRPVSASNIARSCQSNKWWLIRLEQRRGNVLRAAIEFVEVVVTIAGGLLIRWSQVRFLHGPPGSSGSSKRSSTLVVMRKMLLS